MGWLWTSSSDANADNSRNDSPTNSKIALTDEQKLRVFGKPRVAPTSSTSGVSERDQQSSTQSQQSDAELESFLRSFSAPDTTSTRQQTHPSSSNSTTSTTTTAAAADDPAPFELPDRINPDGSLNISPEALLPRTMSCRQAFDQAYYCQSLGGKFNDIYRYGELRSCSEHWSAFWFCMRTRTLPDLDRQRAIADYYRTRDEKKRAEFGSSEDVWELRTTAVEKAFWRDPDAEEG